MYRRTLQAIIESYLFQQHVIIIYGARQVGKTTLVQQILRNHQNKRTLYLNGDEFDIRQRLQPTNYDKLRSFVGEPDILVIDEAQRIENIGLTLKILFDNNPAMQIIATGSSSFDLANKINEPLTGRSIEFILYPLSIAETAHHGIQAERYRDDILLYGSYPAILSAAGQQRKILLSTLTNQYLYKDIITLEDIRKPAVIHKLLQLLAYQVGSEVSLQELANSLDISKHTVERYLDLLQKAFVIVSLGAYNRNLRNEVAKSRKIYFYDLGVRNALINNFNSLDVRPDVGALWENFLIIERMKHNHYHQILGNCYFWRNYSQQEIDFVEDRDGNLYAFEFKWKERKRTKIPKSFAEAYPKHDFSVVTRENWLSFLPLEAP